MNAQIYTRKLTSDPPFIIFIHYGLPFYICFTFFDIILLLYYPCHHIPLYTFHRKYIFSFKFNTYILNCLSKQFYKFTVHTSFTIPTQPNS